MKSPHGEQMRQMAQLTIPSTVQHYPYAELMESLNFFRGVYVESLNHLRDSDLDIDALSVEQIDRACDYVAQRVPPDSFDYTLNGAVLDLPEERDLIILDIKTRNPVELIIAGLALPLAVAVVISGGEFQIAGVLKVKLPPLGHGIESLRSALRPLDGKALSERSGSRRMGLSQDTVEAAPKTR